MAARKVGRPKRGAALAAAASSLAAAAADTGEDGEDEDRPTTASGRPLTDAAAETIASSLETSTKEPKATVKRLSESDNKYSTLDVVDASLVNEEWIARTYGGGKYRVMVHGPTKDGRWGYVRNDSYDIDGSIPFRGALMGRRTATLHNPDGSLVGSSHADADIGALIKSQMIELVQSQSDVRRQDREGQSTVMAMMMQIMKESSQQNQQFMQLMLTMVAQKPTGPNLVELLGVITPLLQPLLGSRKDPMDMAMQLMTLTGNKGGTSQLSEIIAAFRELRESRDLFDSPDREPEDSSLLGAITRMAPQLLTFLTQQQKAELAEQPIATAAPVAPAPMPTFLQNPVTPPPMVASAPSTVGAEGSDMGMVTAMLKPYGPMLVERAMADDDPFDLGHSVALMIPVAMRNMVDQFVAQETATADVIAAIPALSPYPAWVGEFVAGVRERFHPTEEADDEDDEPAPAGDGAAGED